MRCLAHRAVDQEAFTISRYCYPPSKQVCNGSLLTLSKLHLLSLKMKSICFIQQNLNGLMKQSMQDLASYL